jgi:leucyl aminopeptidase
MTTTSLLEVVYADAAAAVGADAEPVVAVGVLAVEDEEGPRLAQGTPDPVVLGALTVPVSIDPEVARRRGFQGKSGQTMVVLGAGDDPAVVYAGVGRGPTHSVDGVRRAVAAVAREAGRSGTAVVVVPAAGVEASDERAAQAVAEAAVLASYRFVAHKSADEGGRIDRLLVVSPAMAAAVGRRGVERGQRIARAVCLARDLVNEPPSSMTPRRLVEIAQGELGSENRVTLEVWDEERIESERLGGLLGVARGSAEPPRLVRATYEPQDPVSVAGKVPHLVLVGKGITFDSGGLSLKTADGMTTMKTDMSGAAAVLAAVSACNDLGVRVRVTALAPITENMPGGRATKPGDVLTIRNGKTIEVLNTDAEGRLVLADGLSLAAELRPDAIVDLATLTGACVVALGGSVAGLFGNDDKLIEELKSASARAGEALWPLPMPERYESHIDSDIADMKNIGKAGQAGAIAAALLLARFVDSVPWAHLDIAGPARSDEDDGVVTKGGTGFGVRTLLELLEGFGQPEE